MGNETIKPAIGHIDHLDIFCQFHAFLVLGACLLKSFGIFGDNDSSSLEKHWWGGVLQDFLQDETENESKPVEKPAKNTPAQTAASGTIPKLSNIPKYSNKAYVTINKGKPYFTDKDLVTESYEYYSKLDSKGRCGVVVACIGKDIMPTEDRGSIGNVKPTGWHTVKYAGIVEGNYLYNRCHLLGYQLTGENANTKNLITGTRYMNTKGMLPFENMVADYVKETGNHVLLRVTPIFDGKNLLASGVLMEAMSVEDNGKGILFNVFCYNVQPGIIIDYSDGSSKAEVVSEPESESKPETDKPSDETSGKYAVNGKNGKIHIVGECSATGDGSNAMTEPIYFDTYEEALAYVEKHFPKQKKPQCGNCW